METFTRAAVAECSLCKRLEWTRAGDDVFAVRKALENDGWRRVTITGEWLCELHTDVHPSARTAR